MTIVIGIKIALILFFLVMFLRRPSLTWGIGLLTVTAAVLIDTLLFTFNSDALREEMGFFYYVIAGTLFGGATLWLWGIFIPRLIPKNLSQTQSNSNTNDDFSHHEPSRVSSEGTVIDNKMLYDEIRNRFGREDVLDLMFDLNINETDVMPIDQDMNHLIINIMDNAQREGKSGALALAVERILTPPPPENLPRLEKIDADSPPTILRHYMLTHFSLDDLEQTADDLDVDWEQLDAGTKREKTRSLLQYLYRRNRISDLIQFIKSPELPAAGKGKNANKS